MKQEEWSPLIEELEEQTPNKGWIIQENLKVGEAFKIKKIRTSFYFNFRWCFTDGE
ncbi:hypothetical protein [Listeria fleischmannii]|uniref:hypothetical protein n=1 Tax=Listeria fleischmannii TaxID=1069827 RepID=UPI0004AE3D8A|nr:hypothetical protein [Listeria fleischmannii]